MTVSAEGECVCDVILEQDRVPYMVYTTVDGTY